MKTKQNRINRRPGPAFDLARIPLNPGQKHLQTVEHSLVVIRESANRFSSKSQHAAENSPFAEVAVN
jgi:hypothetical protein